MKYFAKRFFYFLIFLSCARPSGAAEKFALNKDDTYVGFEVGYLVLSRVRGRFEDFQGIMVIDEENPERSHVAISINTSSVETGIKKRDAIIRGPMLFDSAHFPTMSFHSATIEIDRDNSGHIGGELSLMSVTKPLTLDFVRIRGQNRHLGYGYKVTGEIRRSDFDMDGYAGVIGNTVTLLICYNMQACKYDEQDHQRRRYNR